MSASAFDEFLETLREPGKVTLSPRRLADALQMGTSELALLARVHRNTVTGNPGSAQLQAAMREIVKVLAAASRVNESRQAAVFWFITYPLAEFGYRTAAELVREGRVEPVLLYLATLEAGAKGYRGLTDMYASGKRSLAIRSPSRQSAPHRVAGRPKSSR